MKDVFVKIRKFDSNEIIYDGKVSVEDNSTMLDVICALDQDAYNNEGSNAIVNLDEWGTLLQKIWNPRERNYYSDVILRGRKSLQERKILPLKEKVDYNLPDGSRISIALQDQTDQRFSGPQFMFHLKKASQKHYAEKRILFFYEMLHDMHKLETF